MPGSVFPLDHPRPTRSHAEQTVYDALKARLPDGWSAWHSLKILAPHGVWEGEGDFVILVPNRGLLILEVKGGRLELRDGHWFQSGREMEKAPRDQAQGFARNLSAELKRRGLNAPFGIASVFPECEFSGGPGSADLIGAVMGPRDLTHLAQSLASVVDRVIPRGDLSRTEALRRGLETLWGKTWVPHVVLRHRVEAMTERMLALDEKQLEILYATESNPRAIVEGAAGTGKTVVARELCRRKALEGKRGLYVCYTEALAQVIDQQLRREMAESDGHGGPPNPVGSVRAVALRQYARELTGEDIPARSGDPLEFWETISARAVAHVPPDAERPDFIVVDEAQDLAAPDWQLIRALSKARGLWLFHDPRQSFWSERGIPDDLLQSIPMRLKLPQQHRCPDAITRFAETFARADAPPPTQDVSLKIVQGEEADLVPRLAATLDALVREGAKPEEIAVVSLGGQKRTTLWSLDKAGAHRLVRCDSPEAASCVVADTFLRFKGLERPFIVIAELDGGLGHKFDTRMHIALTRATVGVRILCTRDELDRDARLGALAGAG